MHWPPRSCFCLVVLVLQTGGCALYKAPDWAQRPVASPAPPVPGPLITDRFFLRPGSDLVGEMQVLLARYEDTFVDIARAHDLGFDELEEANPGVDPWLPGAGTRIVLPTQFILPDAPRVGIVLNVGAKRIFFYPPTLPGALPVVITHPVGIGREGWQTPMGITRVTAKIKDPVWTVPPSILREHREAGDPLPPRVPAGPDNPLGAYALRLGFPSYLIHGTNKPSGIGMRVSHGCVQLFPEDIESLFKEVPVGTPVNILNQPQLLGWQGDTLYLEAHVPLEDDRRKLSGPLRQRLDREVRNHKPGLVPQVQPDPALVTATLAQSRGFPVPILNPAADGERVSAQ